MNYDATDLDIIEQLKQDGRKSLREIAENLDISPSTASNRFTKLKEKGIIKGFRPVIDYESLGFGFTTVTHIRSRSGMIEEVQERLSDLGFVSSYFLVTGETDIIVISRFKGRMEMNEKLRELQSLKGVEDTNTNVVLESKGFFDGVSLEDARGSL